MVKALLRPARRDANPMQAGVYSAVTHYLKAVDALGSDEAKAVVAKMRDMPIHDFFADRGLLRADGRMVHDMYLVEVKKPEESHYPWDYYKILKTIPGEEAFRPMSEGGCPLLRQTLDATDSAALMSPIGTMRIVGMSALFPLLDH